MPNFVESFDAPAGSATTYTLSAGQTAQGTLAGTGDRDWYRVELSAGQTYTFAMTGTGVSNVRDPYIRIYAPGGSTIVGQDDNSLPGSNSILSYTAATTGTYFVEASAQSGGTGQYGVAFSSGSRASFDLQMSAGVIDGDVSWSGTPGLGATVTLGFRATSDGEEPNFSRFSSDQIAATLQVLQFYTDVSGLRFNVIAPGGYTDNATILLGNYNNADGSGGYAYYPGSTASGSLAGNIYINLWGGSSTTSLPFGSYSFFTLLHEMGHAIGLSHPGSYNAAPGTSITYEANAQFRQDTHQYTVMSYFDEVYTSGGSFGYPDTLMLSDIYALQQIYGANTSTRATDTIYGFGSNAGGPYDFAVNSSPALCIWDGGGTDTLNASGFGQNQIFNLNPGSFCDIGGLIGNVSIAIGVTLENAIGGSGADRFYLTSASTANVINGGGGADTVHLPYSYNSGYMVSGSASSLAIGGTAGSDLLQNVGFVVFANGRQVGTAELAAEWLVYEDPAQHRGAPEADFNGDGRDDLLWRRTSDGVTVIWEQNGLAPAGGGTTVWQHGTDWSVQGVGDFNGDGRADILWRQAGTGVTDVWMQNGLTPVGGGATGWQHGTDWSVQGIADFNGDGRSDILWRRGAGTTVIWEQNGLAPIAGGATGWQHGNDWTVSGTGDFNGDGRDDILWRRSTDGVTVIWEQNGLSPSGGGTTAWQHGSDWSVQGVTDFNGDGREDILWRRSTDGVTVIWEQNGLAPIAGGATGWQHGNDWQVAEVGDYNGDGRGDILWRHGASGTTVIWEQDGLNPIGGGTTQWQHGTDWVL